jgi:predicted O-methyltransferase YrrM
MGLVDREEIALETTPESEVRDLMKIAIGLVDREEIALETTPESEVRDLMKRVYGEPAGATAGAFSRDGMNFVELVRLYEVARKSGCRSALEIGMATGTSSVVIGEALRKNGGGSLTSVDPFQTSREGYDSAGLKSMISAGLDGSHRLIERPDYLAMPQLVEGNSSFDLILIDGYHSFDYTMLDVFFADLLLKIGGVLALHDSSMPSVFKVLRYLELHKSYERISPPAVMDVDSLPLRFLRRLRTLASGPRSARLARSRREQWKNLSAYRKLADRQAPEAVFGL